MCGINGFVYKTNLENPEKLLQNMNKAISHRGPDDSGSFVDIHGNTTIGLGQVRLSILDLSQAGHQPMFYTQDLGMIHQDVLKHSNIKNYVSIVFNGEIYNYEDIKNKLKKKGYKFNTSCDTEIILAAYLEYGQDCVKQFNGMRAFVLYDPTKQILFCSRDRLGKKPLYYLLENDRLIFSSELKGILKHKIKKEINQEALDFFLGTKFIPAPWSIYEGIYKLESRQNIIIDISTMQVDKYYYYELPRYNPIYDKNKLLNRGKELLENATKIRMFNSDVPVGAFLSGGLDSSSIVSQMTKFTKPENLNTFSIGFEGKYDETKYINIVKDSFKTKHHHKYFHEKDFKNLINDISFIYDEPFGDYSSFPTTFLSQFTKDKVTVALSGDGGDEIFGGYLNHRVAARLEFFYKIPRFLRKTLYYLMPKTSNNLSLLSKLKEGLRLSLVPLHEIYTQFLSKDIYKPDIYIKWTEDRLLELLKINNGNFVQTIIDFDLYYQTLGDHFLTKTDRASMSVALEIRSPFLDYRFVEYAHQIPTKYKVSTQKTKILMRDLIKDMVPTSIIKRKKQGFQPPIAKWILKKSYMNEIKKGIDFLYEKGILSQQWKDFYVKKVLKNKNDIYDDYKVRMFLLIKWYERRFTKIK